MGYKPLCFGLTCILFAYYIYTPMPENIEEPWKATILEKTGIKRFDELFSIIIKLDYTQPISDENVTVMDTTFSDIPVRLYLPKRKRESQRPAVIFIHGGAFVLGSYSDSSGGTLAAGVTQLIQNDPELKHKLKAQALIYPGLQVVDLSLPSHRENEHGPLLSWKLAIKLACLYLTQDKVLPQAMMKNQHMPHGSMQLFKLVNWSTFLPEEYKKSHVYTEPILGRLNPSYSILLDSRLSPLAVNDSQLQNLPLTYILTCQHDILRDDGLMYVSRLQNVGVKVSHDHMEDGIHGALSFMASPIYLKLGIRIKDKYINWLEENL
ncbi:arylacetamide deacetylase-like 2 isoform X3 [Moschus berezovskii]|uniref:arylacetamide deacetylase-like 2 isoform X3 n=1 Tax=Moschus berezovskii TaxID=68408 RepID=UPI0024445F0F|nr:arylacetamide deacetylase-like 2 isoform X3 [Moschus berezovskii]